MDMSYAKETAVIIPAYKPDSRLPPYVAALREAGIGKVVIVDDLIATGGTTEAIIKLIEELGGKVVKICFVMELAGLKGREHLKGYDVESSIIYEGK